MNVLVRSWNSSEAKVYHCVIPFGSEVTEETAQLVIPNLDYFAVEKLALQLHDMLSRRELPATQAHLSQ